MVEKKFKVLRVIGTVYKVLGIIAGVLTILGSIAACVLTFVGGTAMQQFQRGLGNAGVGYAGGAVGGIIAAVVILIYGAIMTLALYGIGEGIYLLLAMEENTRVTADYLQRYSEQQ